MWKGDYTSKYIEEICRKTGKERPFAVFVQLLLTSIQNKKGSSQVYIDLLGSQDLQLLKARSQNNNENQQQMSNLSQKNNKRYMILTNMLKGNKVHYPLPLNPVETGVFHLDKETMQQMVKRMSQTLNDFKTMSVSNSGGFSQQSQSNSLSNGFGLINNAGRQTAKEFFSKENITHPAVEDNAKLKEKLRLLEEARSMGGGQGSISKIMEEKSRIDQDLNQFKSMAASEFNKLKSMRSELSRQIDDTRSEITSQRPSSSYSQQESLQNQTVTSNFSINAVEELRRQLADQSIELEELREQYKKKFSLQQKDLEDSYSEISTFRQEEKALRVKVNQIENQLELNIKRLDIICKSKGLPRPQRKTSQNPSSKYTSPYRQGGNSQEKKPVLRNNSNSVGKNTSPFRNYSYTPPNRRQASGNYSPSNLSNGSGNKGIKSSNYSPINLRNRQQSPGEKSNTSNNSTGKTQNRLYSPSGRVRDGSGSLHGHSEVANRVRREPAAGGSSLNGSSRSNSKSRTQQVSTPPSQGLRQTSGQRNQPQKVYGNLYNKNKTTVSSTSKQPTTQQNTDKKTLFNSSNQQPRSTTTILSQQKAVTAAGTIDDKIERLQSLLKMAKPN